MSGNRPAYHGLKRSLTGIFATDSGVFGGAPALRPARTLDIGTCHASLTRIVRGAPGAITTGT